MKKELLFALSIAAGPAWPQTPRLDDGLDPTFANGGACTRAAVAAIRGCRFEIQDDLWITLGNCANLADPQARAACERRAVRSQQEGEKTCGEQYAERIKICQRTGEEPYQPRLEPAMFVDPAEIGRTVTPNPFFPLVRGMTTVFRKGKEISTDTVTSETREILGIKCAVIHAVVENSGDLIEDTKDWYAQDVQGNVWYLGEVAQEIEDGEIVSLKGSWTAGVDGAAAGIIMKAAPAVGDFYRQEFSLGNAEDVAEVTSLTESARVPAGSCEGNCVAIRESAPIEPGVASVKYYMRGVGLLLSVDPETGERSELVEVKRESGSR